MSTGFRFLHLFCLEEHCEVRGFREGLSSVLLLESGLLKRQLLGTTGKMIYVVVAAMLPTFDLHDFMKLEFLVIELSGGACRSSWTCPCARLCLCHRPLYIVRLSAETASALEHILAFFRALQATKSPVPWEDEMLLTSNLSVSKQKRSNFWGSSGFHWSWLEFHHSISLLFHCQSSSLPQNWNFLIGKLSSPRYTHALKKLLESFGSSFWSIGGWTLMLALQIVFRF